MATHKFEPAKRDDNSDPITGEPGAHPIESGVGAAVGGFAAGAALGALGGPIGAAAGAVVGGVVGGLAGKEVGEQIDPTSEDAFWRENYRHQKYVEKGADYSTYQPAYRYGWEARSAFAGQPFDEIEPELKAGWERQERPLGWDKARHATKDAWFRVHNSTSYNAGPSMKVG
jgi:hypothetical protein